MSEGEENWIDRPAIQQDNNYREFMKWITEGGLRYGVAKSNNYPHPEEYYQKQVADPCKKRQVIVVGAGMSGLSAAYELSQIGHEVTILEAQSRVGGRVHTFRRGFADGLHCEAGAMRLPPNHFLTRHYLDHFKVATRTFQNKNEKGYMYMYGDKIRIEEFESNNKHYTDKWWPGWDANLSEELKKRAGIQGILDLYEQTMKPVKEDLGRHPTKQQWQTWVKKWSKLSLEDFLRSTIYQEKEDLQLRPWTEEAIHAYKVATYTTQFHADLVSFLREELGEWWKDPLRTPTDGMDSLPKAFLKKNDHGWNKNVEMSKNTVFGIRVEKVENLDTGGKKRVRVTGTNLVTGMRKSFEGDAVILTLPLPILRQLDISFSIDQQKALASFTYESSTKIMMQCKTRFWQKDVGQGGFSKSSLQIGQLHYPDYNSSGIPDDERGILLVYTWGSNALTFGAESHKTAIESAVRQVSKIHPEILNEFEVGKVQAWHSDPSAQGAYAGLLPFEYENAFHTLVLPTETMYLAGEALSWSNGWIQGALFSGLCAAYAFQNFVETGKIVSVVDPSSQTD